MQDDSLQEDQDLSAALNAYTEARMRLSSKFRNRGFWPASSSGTKGRGKGKQKGKFGQFKGSRKSLQQRILESACRYCNRKGHWRAECPERLKALSNMPGAPSNAAMSTAAAIISEPVDNDFDFLPLEFVQLPELTETGIDESRKRLIQTCVTSCPMSIRDRIRIRARDHLGGIIAGSNPKTQPGAIKQPSPLRTDESRVLRPTVQSATMPGSHIRSDSVLLAIHGPMGILDTGAAKSVVGSEQVSEIIASRAAAVEAMQQSSDVPIW